MATNTCEKNRASVRKPTTITTAAANWYGYNYIQTVRTKKKKKEKKKKKKKKVAPLAGLETDDNQQRREQASPRSSHFLHFKPGFECALFSSSVSLFCSVASPKKEGLGNQLARKRTEK